jgi:hypothetical protein
MGEHFKTGQRSGTRTKSIYTSMPFWRKSDKSQGFGERVPQENNVLGSVCVSDKPNHHSSGASCAVIRNSHHRLTLAPVSFGGVLKSL